MKILIIAGLIVFIIFVWALVLALCTAGADETGRSILYDNPEYFKHDEPEWLRKENKKEKECTKCHYIDLENYEYPCDDCSRLKADSTTDRWELSESLKYMQYGKSVIKGLEAGFNDFERKENEKWED